MVVFALALFGVVPMRGEQCALGAATSFDFPGAPQSIAAADLNRDGRIDLAVAGAASIAVFLGNGSGGFVAGASVFSPNYFDQILIADVNGDGKPDLAAVSELKGLTILLGRGDGTFAEPAFFTAGARPIALALGDFNADGKLDAVLANFNSSDISFLFGDGAGGFGAPQNLDLGNAQPQSLAVGDFDRNGTIDIALSAAGVLEIGFILIGADGNISPETLPVNWPPHLLMATDIDGDGITDLAMTNHSGSWVSVFRFSQTGGVGAVIDTRGASANGIAIADFDGDGKRDVVLSDANEPRIVILPGSGDGTFGTPSYRASGTGPFGLATGDFNGDGRPDLAVANLLSDSVSVFVNTCPSSRRRAVRR
ncbi:MAG: VCBS repeat-containing protein [Thermoanaerobaculia bacterium]|nr:VCBS repeat-containing protein [Thermoanaerobaculia bacterium]